MDLPGNLVGTKLYRRSYPIQGIRLTLENYKQIADFIGASYGPDPECELGSCSEGDCLSIHIHDKLNRGYVGDDWIMQNEFSKIYFFMPHEEVMKKYFTHSERLTEDEKYAKVFTHVVKAMQVQAKATFHNETDGMDLVAMEAARKILEDLI